MRLTWRQPLERLHTAEPVEPIGLSIDEEPQTAGQLPAAAWKDAVRHQKTMKD